MPAIEALAAQMGSQAINNIMALPFAGANQKWQMDTARKMQALELEGEQVRLQRQFDQQMKLWNATGYGAQMRQLKEAGLNPALIYGQSGGGGMSVNTGTVGGTTQSAMPPPQSHGGEGMGLMIGQMGLLDAQRKNIEMDTKLKESQLPEGGARATNLGAQTDLTRVQTEIARVQASVARQTINEQMKSWENLVEQQAANIKQTGLQNKLAESTMNDNIKMVKQQVIGQILENTLTQAKIGTQGEITKLTQEQQTLVRTQAKAIAAKVMQDWEQLEINKTGERVNWNKYLNEEGAIIPQELRGILEQSVDGILRKGGK